MRAAERAVGAHRARLERDIEVMAGQAFGLQLGAARPDHEDLGMGGRVRQFAGAVARARHDGAFGRHQHRAHRHFAAPGGGARLVQRGLHVVVEFHAPAIAPSVRRANPLLPGA